MNDVTPHIHEPNEEQVIGFGAQQGNSFYYDWRKLVVWYGYRELKGLEISILRRGRFQSGELWEWTNSIMCLPFATYVDERILLTQTEMYKGLYFGLLSISHAT